MTQQRALIFHGYRATPQDHWFAWVAEQLKEHGIQTDIPALPHSLTPVAGPWEEAVRQAVGEPDDSTAVVGHSLGCLTILRALLSLKGEWRLGTLVLVSGFTEKLPALPELDDFIGEDTEVEALTERIRKIVVIRSDNDPLVPLTLTDRLAERLGVSPVIVPGAGHFLAAEGVTALPAVRDAIVS